MRIFLVAISSSLLLGSGLVIAGEFGELNSVGVSASISVGFSSDEIRIIRQHYDSLGGSGKSKGKGKNKAKGLPPGIAKNLARGKPLPPGIAKKHLPSDLLRVLPPVRHGHERIIVDGKILLVEIATQVVRDVITDIVFDR